MADRITFHDCCRIILEDWQFRQDGVVPELRDSRRNLLALLTSEFDIGWQDDGPAFPHDEGLPAIVVDMPRLFTRLVGPFDGWLEYRPLPGEMDVLNQHRDGLEAAKLALRERWVALFRDLLLLRWPDADTRETSWSRLRALGLGERLDEIDFF